MSLVGKEPKHYDGICYTPTSFTIRRTFLKHLWDYEPSLQSELFEAWCRFYGKQNQSKLYFINEYAASKQIELGGSRTKYQCFAEQTDRSMEPKWSDDGEQLLFEFVEKNAEMLRIFYRDKLMSMQEMLNQQVSNVQLEQDIDVHVSLEAFRDKLLFEIQIVEQGRFTAVNHYYLPHFRTAELVRFLAKFNTLNLGNFTNGANIKLDNTPNTQSYGDFVLISPPIPSAALAQVVAGYQQANLNPQVVERTSHQGMSEFRISISKIAIATHPEMFDERWYPLCVEFATKIKPMLAQPPTNYKECISGDGQESPAKRQAI